MPYVMCVGVICSQVATVCWFDSTWWTWT